MYVFSYLCYHCTNYQTGIESDYEGHVILEHPGKPAYPSKADIEKLGLTPQEKQWEK